ncbi:MAG: SDR family oxidoreductase [Proteobacteria bacterium]|nr:SDR family oxidoreductase [Pseudomonadota bacterium]
MPSVLITGANRGLGLEFVRQYLAEGWNVHACARHLSSEFQVLAKKFGTLSIHVLDVTDHAAVTALAKQLSAAPLDVLINNAGIYGPDDNFSGTGQNLASMDYDLWRKVFEVNTLAPYKVTQSFAPHLEKGGQKKVVMLTSEMGSISEMKDSGMASTCYQTSKAALNMEGVSLAAELKAKGIAVLLLHPGWVKTDMGGQGAPLSPKESIKGLRKVIANSNLRDTGSYRDYAGRKLEW